MSTAQQSSSPAIKQPSNQAAQQSSSRQLKRWSLFILLAALTPTLTMAQLRQEWQGASSKPNVTGDDRPGWGDWQPYPSDSRP